MKNITRFMLLFSCLTVILGCTEEEELTVTQLSDATIAIECANTLSQCASGSDGDTIRLYLYEDVNTNCTQALDSGLSSGFSLTYTAKASVIGVFDTDALTASVSSGWTNTSDFSVTQLTDGNYRLCIVVDSDDDTYLDSGEAYETLAITFAGSVQTISANTFVAY